jgi:predicted dinucleotide-binding enzyme
MRVAIIGAGHIGGGIARQLAAAGHEIMLSYSRNPDSLAASATEIGSAVSVGTPAEAVAFGEVVVVSVPWRVLPEALAELGSLAGKIVVDTTNHYGAPQPPTGWTAAQFTAERMAGARYTKSFNTLTAGFQASAAGRTGEQLVVQWLCGDDVEAKQIVAGLIDDAGFRPVDLGGTADAAVMESPRRPGAVYGEEYRVPDADPVIAAVAAGTPIPATPHYP